MADKAAKVLVGAFLDQVRLVGSKRRSSSSSRQ